jgi:two-component system KDP operon response regulator KdpE
MKALIIEDDPDIAEAICQTLHMRWPMGYFASTHLGRQGIELAESDHPNFIVLDLGLPDMNGLEVLKQIRSFSTVPVIILSVSSDEVDIVRGLECGANDYIVKPCGHLELLARIKARVCDENSLDEEAPISLGDLNFDPLSRVLVCEDKEIDLTATESSIVHHLITHAGQVCNYHNIAEDVWGDYYPGSVDSLRVHIRRLRNKIEVDPGNPKIIVTKGGVGYFINRPVPVKSDWKNYTAARLEGTECLQDETGGLVNGEARL